MAGSASTRRVSGDLLLAAGRHPLAAAVAANLRRRCRVPASVRRIVVGASGGPDSTALLTILAALATRRDAMPMPIAICVHHGLREAADEECALVTRLARRLGVRCERMDVRPAARRGNVSANARDDRYAALLDAARRHEAQAVATAHHADDRLETLLLAIGRGKGLRGFAAPRWSRGLTPEVRLIRPLLDLTKEACVAFCDEFALETAEDPGNADPRRGRGHLRRCVLPPFLARYPHAGAHASRAIDEAALAISALDRLVARRFGPPGVSAWDRARFKGADPVLAAWALRRAAHGIDANATANVRRSSWERVASAAVDSSMRRRVFQWGRLGCVVDASEVRLTVEIRPR